MDKRDFIRVAGGGVIASIFASSLTTGAALASAVGDGVWEPLAQRESDPRRRALAFAQLAPNPHNMQPWIVDLRGADQIHVSIDRARLLPVTDPFDRQITVGTGAFLALLQLAAEAQGYGVEMHAFPEGASGDRLDDRPVALIRLHAGAPVARDPLFAQVLSRRTSRVAFKSDPVEPRQLEAMLTSAREAGLLADGVVDGARLGGLRHLTEEAALVEQGDRAANGESADRTFIGSRAVAEHPWGIGLRGMKFDMLAATGLLTREGLKTPGSAAYQGQIDFMRSLARSSAGFVWITTPGNSRLDQLSAGRAYLRFNLAASAQGLGIQPMSQALQEYASMAPLFQRAHALLAPGGGRVQMLARIGVVAERVAHAPRRGIDALIRKS